MQRPRAMMNKECAHSLLSRISNRHVPLANHLRPLANHLALLWTPYTGKYTQTTTELRLLSYQRIAL